MKYSFAVCTFCVTAFAVSVGRSVMGAPPSPPAGRLAYLHDGTVCVVSLPSRKEMKAIPQSKGAVEFSLSPQKDGTVVFFAPKQAGSDTSESPFQTFYSQPPYSAAHPLPLLLNKNDTITVRWTAKGEAEIGIGDLNTRRLDPRTGTLTQEAEKGSNEAMAYTGDKDQITWKSGTGPERILFSPSAPATLLAALKRAHNPANLKDITDAIDPDSGKDLHNWSVGTAAPTPDKKTVFFATNLGTGRGAQGNTLFCFFAANVQTGELAVLSKAGTFFGRIPTNCSVSPEGKSLLFTTTVHVSAADNSYSVFVMDLATQKTRELISSDPAHKADVNLVDGCCWSPEGRYVAISALYYKKRSAVENEPDLSHATLYIKDAATGKTVRTLPHAQEPKWGAL